MHVYTYMHVIHVCLYIQAQIVQNVYVYVCVYVYIHIYICIYVYTYIYIDIYTYTCMCVSQVSDPISLGLGSNQQISARFCLIIMCIYHIHMKCMCIRYMNIHITRVGL